MRLIAVMPCGAILTTACGNVLVSCGSILMKVTMTVSGHDTAVGNLVAVILTAALICIRLVMIRQPMPKAFMALQLKMAAGIRVTVMAAVKTSFLQAVFMEPGMAITAAIQM